MKSIEGLIAAVYPPLDKDGNLNLDGVGPYSNFLSNRQVDGAFLNGSTGDFASMSLEERKLITEEWCRCKPAGFKLMVHVGDTNIDHSVTLAKHANNLGVDAISALAPYYYKPSNNKDLVAICQKIAHSASEIPFFYYHIPQLTGVDFNMVEFMEMAIKKIPNFRGIKYSHHDLVEFKHCMEYGAGAYDVFFGMDEILISVLALGARGAIGSTYNHLGPLFKKLIEQFHSGAQQEASNLQFEIMKFVKILERHGYHASSKTALKLMGLDLGPVRMPLKNLSSSEIEELEQELSASGIFDLVNSAKQSTS